MTIIDWGTLTYPHLAVYHDKCHKKLNEKYFINRQWYSNYPKVIELDYLKRRKVFYVFGVFIYLSSLLICAQTFLKIYLLNYLYVDIFIIFGMIFIISFIAYMVYIYLKALIAIDKIEKFCK